MVEITIYDGGGGLFRTGNRENRKDWGREGDGAGTVTDVWDFVGYSHGKESAGGRSH